MIFELFVIFDVYGINEKSVSIRAIRVRKKSVLSVQTV